MGTSRRRFSREFKLEAVRMVAGGRHSLAQVARELDLRPEMLRRWKRQVEQDGDEAFPGHGRLKADDEQLRQLLRENQRPALCAGCSGCLRAATTPGSAARRASVGGRIADYCTRSGSSTGGAEEPTAARASTPSCERREFAVAGTGWPG
jgi:transposase